MKYLCVVDQDRFTSEDVKSYDYFDDYDPEIFSGATVAEAAEKAYRYYSSEDVTEDYVIQQSYCERYVWREHEPEEYWVTMLLYEIDSDIVAFNWGDTKEEAKEKALMDLGYSKEEFDTVEDE